MNETEAAVEPLTLRDRIAAWWTALPREDLIGLLALAAVLGVSMLLVTCRQPPDLEQAPQPAGVQPNPLMPLVLRIDALEAEVARLAVAKEVSEPYPAHSGRSAPRAANRPAEPTPAPPSNWGTTDLDREISAFAESLAQPTQEQTQ